MTRAIPASLAAILVVTVISIALNQSTSSQGEHRVATVGDMLRTNSTLLR